MNSMDTLAIEHISMISRKILVHMAFIEIKCIYILRRTLYCILWMYEIKCIEQNDILAYKKTKPANL